MSLYNRIRHFCVLITFLGLSHNAVAQEVATPNLKKVLLQNGDEHPWSSVNYPDAYPADASEDLLVSADKGYSITVIIESLDLDGSNGDLLAMKAGTSLEDEGEGKVFTFSLKSERKYAIHTNNVYFSFKVYGDNSNGKKGFSLRYQRVGEVLAVTTTEGTTTEQVTWPTPSGSESMHYVGYIYGKNEKDFLDPETLTNLKMALSEMAKKYCETNNIVLTETITKKNIEINYLVECPDTWPDSDVCVKVRFAVPILYDQENSLWKGYQLSADNLEIMWNQYGDDFLKNYDMKVYKEPDNRFAFEKWVIMFCIILILFLVLLLVIRCTLRYIVNRENKYERTKRRASDVGSIISHTPRSTKTSLTPHPHQVTPPLFENDYSYNIYDPDDAISRTNYKLPVGNQNFSYFEDDDDDSDIDVYNPDFSGSHHNDSNNKYVPT